METNLNRLHIPHAPTESIDLYPDTNGEPMAVSDLHRLILIRTLRVLDEYFKQDPEAYVSGDILLYYVEGNPRKSVSPDVLVSFGLGKKLRRNYLVWEEGKVPDFVMEFSSKNTYRNDLGHKMKLYASLGIQDYVLYDAEGLYLSSPLMGFTLVDGEYIPIAPGPNGGLHATALGLDFYVDAMGLGIYDPVAEAWLQTPEESASERADQEAERAQQESLARQKAEAEVARLQEELARLKARS